MDKKGAERKPEGCSAIHAESPTQKVVFYFLG